MSISIKFWTKNHFGREKRHAWSNLLSSEAASEWLFECLETFQASNIEIVLQNEKKIASKLVSIHLFLIWLDAPWELGPSQVTRKFHVEISIQ